GKILAAHLGLRAGDDLCRIDHGARDFLDHPGLFFLIHQHAEDVTDVDVDFDLEGGGDAGADRAHALAHQRAHVIGEAAHRAAQLGFAGDHVIGRAGVDLRDRHYGGLHRIDVAADDALQRLSYGHRDDDGVLGAFRHRAMRAIAVDHDVEEIGARHR